MVHSRERWADADGDWGSRRRAWGRNQGLHEWSPCTYSGSCAPAPGSRVRHGCPMASCHVVVFLSLARPPSPPSRHMPPLLLPGIHIHGVDENVDLHLVARHAIHEMRVTKTPHASAPRFIVSRKRQNQNPFEGQRGKMEMRDRGASRSFPSAFPFARSAWQVTGRAKRHIEKD